jgi:hypothetical protein
MSDLKKRIGEHLLCVAIDLNEARQELIDAQIKVEQIASKYNDLIEMSNKIEFNVNDCNNTNVSCVPVFNGYSDTQ